MSSYLRPTEAACLRATALLLSAWNMDLRSMPGSPVSLACGCISSTTTGSAMNAGQWHCCAISSAMSAPRLHTCSCCACLRSCFIRSFTAYTPPCSGLSSPPRPITASKSGAMPASLRLRMMKSRRYSYWSFTHLNAAVSCAGWCPPDIHTAFSSSKTAVLVDVEPGLITKIRFIGLCNMNICQSFLSVTSPAVCLMPDCTP